MATTPTPLIGLSGYARSGKDTAGRALTDVGWERRSFADRLREFLLRLDPIVGALDVDFFGHPETQVTRLSSVVGDIGWEGAKDTVPEVRSLLQRCGTDAGRNVLGDNVWVDATLRDLDPSSAVVVTDVRFPNEAQAIRDRGGIVVRVERPGFGPTVGTDGSVHPSETALDDWPFDATIANSLTVARLRAAMWGVASGQLDRAAAA